MTWQDLAGLSRHDQSTAESYYRYVLTLLLSALSGQVHYLRATKAQFLTRAAFFGELPMSVAKLLGLNYALMQSLLLSSESTNFFCPCVPSTVVTV